MSLIGKNSFAKDFSDEAAAKSLEANKLLDKTLATEAAYETLDDVELEGWKACRYTFRTAANYAKIFVVYTLDRGSAKVLCIVRTLEIDICHLSGMSMQVSVEVPGFAPVEYSVGHDPVPIFEEKIFCHIPYVISAFYTPHLVTGKFVLRVPVVFKTEAKPWDTAPGVRLVSLSDFKSTFPEYKNFIP